MKIKLLFLSATLFFLNNCISQNQTINNVSIGTDNPAYGTMIKANFPNYNGGWARSYSIANESGTQSFISLGSYGEAQNGITTSLNYSYIGTSQANTYMSFLPNGNIGIGTNTPAALLDLQKSYGNDVGIKLSQPGLSIWDIKNTASTGLFTIGAGGGAYFNIVHQTGNVGIGTANPIGKLDVNGPVSLKGKPILDSDGTCSYFKSNAASYFENNGTVSAIITSSGNFGIGTTDPKNKLSVNGTIWAKEVKVSLTDAADWVFEKSYKLKPLAEVEKYINENKHLPEVPSAEEFRQNDMNVSEMSNKLLQKVEELTLYAIEQNKEIERLKTENDKYKSLSERLSTIENQLKK